jgi:putative transcriptional regulator
VDLRHHFLIAMPSQAGSYFGGTLTYLCEHSAQGAMGLLVNRRGSFTMDELCRQSGIEAIASSHDLSRVAVLEGGPVAQQQGFVLHSADGHFTHSANLGHGLALTTARGMLAAIAAGRGPYNYLVALGYAGWGPGQLETELEEGAWLACPAETDILFDVPHELRVERAAAALGIDFSLMSGQTGHA